MSEINIGQTIARCRRSEGLTQEELADYLGVSKAAVSKWELGINLPDLTLVPKISSFFRISIDELFDWHPQLTELQIKELSSSMFSKLPGDPKNVLDQLKQYNSDYSSCWEWLISSVQICLMSLTLAPGFEEEYLDVAFKALDRIEQYCDNAALVSTANMQRAALLQMNDDTLDDAIAIMESLRRYPGNTIDAALVSLYERQGRNEEAVQLRQGYMYSSICQILALISSHLGKEPDLEGALVWIRAGKSLIDGFELDEYMPTLCVPFYLEGVKVFISFEEIESAEEYLLALKSLIEVKLNEGLMNNSYSPLFSNAPNLEDKPMNNAVLIDQTKSYIFEEFERDSELKKASKQSLITESLVHEIRFLIQQ